MIEIFNSNRPVYISNNNKQEFYIRATASSQPMNISEATEYIKNHWGN